MPLKGVTGEKCQSKKALPSVVDCYFHHRVNFPHGIAGRMASPVRFLIFEKNVQMNLYKGIIDRTAWGSLLFGNGCEPDGAERRCPLTPCLFMPLARLKSPSNS